MANVYMHANAESLTPDTEKRSDCLVARVKLAIYPEDFSKIANSPFHLLLYKEYFQYLREVINSSAWSISMWQNGWLLMQKQKIDAPILRDEAYQQLMQDVLRVIDDLEADIDAREAERIQKEEEQKNKRKKLDNVQKSEQN
jgi:hypothetical protein